MNEKKAIAHLKTLRKIDGLNEGLLTIILAFLIGLVGLVFVVGVTLLPFIFPESYFIEHNMDTFDTFQTFMWYLRVFGECCFNILLLAFVVRCLVKPVYSVLSKRKGV